MHIVVHVNKFYNWEKLPPDIMPTEKDIQANRVKPDVNGGWLARVPKEFDTHTLVILPEHELIEMMIQSVVKDGVPLSRAQAMCLYLSRHTMKHNAHPNWMEEFEVNDDGPNEALFKECLAPKVDAGLIEPEDHELMLIEYLKIFTDAQLVDALHAHFNVDKDAVPTKRAARQVRIALRTTQAPKEAK